MFSIIVPTYNRANLISTTIRSVLMQTWPCFEIIVVDDGSTDNTEEVVKAIADSRIRYVRKENGERAAARNHGTALAKGNYLTFLDSDDLFLPHHLQEASWLIEQENKPEWFHLKYRFSDNAMDEDIYGSRKVSDRNHELLSGNYLSCMGVFIRRDIAMKNLFNEDRTLSASEDHELWLRLAAQYPLKINTTITSILVNHESRSVFEVDKEKLIARQNLFLDLVLNNKDLTAFIDGYRNRLRSNSLSYIALHLVITGRYKADGIKYTARAIGNDFSFLTKRRFLAIVKHLILSW